ncbi:hypothetical protein ACFX1R_005555 [Malus domestica]
MGTGIKGTKTRDNNTRTYRKQEHSELIGCRDWSYSSTWQGSCLWSPNCNKACTEREGATAGACLLFKCVCYDGKGCPQGRLAP